MNGEEQADKRLENTIGPMLILTHLTLAFIRADGIGGRLHLLLN